jgi:IMP dehydrogenase
MIREGLTFDDVLLTPKYSTVKSRSSVDLSVNWGGVHCGGFHFKHPIIPANMKNVTGLEMAKTIVKSGGLAILHRFMPIQEQLDNVNEIIDEFSDRNIAVSVGVKKEDIDNIFNFLSCGVRIFCIDVAHGDSEQCLDMIRRIKDLNNSAFVIAGNVASGEGAKRLWRAGADVVKVGVGPGSLCTTRIETGNGVPQLTALMDVAETQRLLREEEESKQQIKPTVSEKGLRILGDIYKQVDGSYFADSPLNSGVFNNSQSKSISNGYKPIPYPDDNIRTFPFIADGGIKSAGDIVKALCFADMVMVGNLFAGSDEAPGGIEIINGNRYKQYAGSSTHKTNHIEGVTAIVPAKGPVQDILTKLIEGLRSGCSYQGAHNLTALKNNPAFTRITNAGLKESHPHDVIVK